MTDPNDWLDEECVSLLHVVIGGGAVALMVAGGIVAVISYMVIA
jgi:hypothetical protein